jgi:hypothetical protein
MPANFPRYPLTACLCVFVVNSQGASLHATYSSFNNSRSLAMPRRVHGCAFSVPLTVEDLQSLLKNSAEPQRPNRKAS